MTVQPAPYGRLKVAELRQLAADRSVKVTGTGRGGRIRKTDLVAALHAADSADPAGPPGRLEDRWQRRWRTTLKQLRDQGSWTNENTPQLEAYIDALRLADFHRAEAEAEPYVVNEDSGRVFAHPGFRLARECDRDALRLAEALELTPVRRRAAGADARDPDPEDRDELDEIE